MSDKKKDAKEADKVEEKDKKNEGLGLLEEVRTQTEFDQIRFLLKIEIGWPAYDEYVRKWFGYSLLFSRFISLFETL